MGIQTDNVFTGSLQDRKVERCRNDAFRVMNQRDLQAWVRLLEFGHLLECLVGGAAVSQDNLNVGQRVCLALHGRQKQPDGFSSLKHGTMTETSPAAVILRLS